MRITITQLPDNPDDLGIAWQSLCEHVQAENSDFVLLPEMPFSSWLASTNNIEQPAWEEAVKTHEHWQTRLSELQVDYVAATKPVIDNGRNHNRSFVYHDGTFEPIHDKYYLPDETGFYEASWYQPGKKTFEIVECGDLRAGFMICTELWFTEHARAYGKQGVHLILNPRATGKFSVDNWLAGGRTVSVVSGAYCASSNRCGTCNGVEFGGAGWLIDPDGEVLAVTSDETPYITIEIDLAKAEKAKSTYPRYVLE